MASNLRDALGVSGGDNWNLGCRTEYCTVIQYSYEKKVSGH